MIEELKEIGIDVGHRRVGRLMRQNAIVIEKDTLKAKRPDFLVDRIKVNRSQDGLPSLAVRNQFTSACHDLIRGIG